MNRIMLVRVLVVVLLILFFTLATRRMSLVPTRLQSIAELGLNLVRVNIAEDLLGKKDGSSSSCSA